MKAVVAIDSFKGCLTSLEAGQAAKEGILRVYPDAQVALLPLADGGEGTVEALTGGMGGAVQRIRVTGPLGSPVECEYGIVQDENGSRTAVIEIAQAAGLTLVPEERRDPLLATTYGVGEVIRDAMERQCRRFLVGIGGSATNDGGIGMLQALGFEFLDRAGNPVSRGARGLKDLAEIRTENALPELRDCTFRVACDVTNPLCGAEGSSAVYGPQKGAAADTIEQMDRWLRAYAELTARVFPHASPDFPGAGAAGGMGFAFRSYLGADLAPGAGIVLEETGFERELASADLVITGEGRLDGQTAMGKAPIGAARLAKRHGIPVFAFAGSVTPEAAACNAAGIDAYFPIPRGVSSLEEAMDRENAVRNMADAVEQVMRVWKLQEKTKKFKNF